MISCCSETEAEVFPEVMFAFLLRRNQKNGITALQERSDRLPEVRISYKRKISRMFSERLTLHECSTLLRGVGLASGSNRGLPPTIGSIKDSEKFPLTQTILDNDATFPPEFATGKKNTAFHSVFKQDIFPSRYLL